MVDIDEVWKLLETVHDPEIPVVSLVEMGIVRKVDVIAASVTVTITPTFSGCPALSAMKADIVQKLNDAGIGQVEVVTVYAPAWTTDWITDEARAKLRAFGLAPPARHDGNFELTLLDVVACPYCGSEKTALRNSFGPTPCRMIFYCNACQQPFEHFKPL